MLDKNEVIRKLTALIPHVIVNINEELKVLKDCLLWLNNNSGKIDDLFKRGEISWLGHIDRAVELKTWQQPYHILGVDGSQIYPDRHQEINCFLLNIGFAEFSYAEQSTVVLKSLPSIYFEQTIEYEFSTENINYLRTEQEFLKGFEYSQIITQNTNARPFVFLFDGPLYFWYLNNKPGDIKNKFLSSYITSLHWFYSKKIPIIGFLSSPKNKEIINLIKRGIEQNIINLGYECTTDFQFITDSDLVSLFLKPYCRTPFFSLATDLSLSYPVHVRPNFCYVNFESEIARIEVPFWLTQEPNFEDYLTILIDQCKKGSGYPIALSEAHEQAVIKAFDRDFFYALLHKIGTQNNYTVSPSQKSIKKKIVGV